MRKFINTSLVCITMATATPALAAGDHYVGAGLGAFTLSTAVNRDTVFGAYALIGHHFSEYFSAEVRLGATANSGDGDATTPQPKQRMDFVAHYIKPQITLTEELTAYLLGGFAVVHGSYQAPAGVKQSKTRISYAYGAGFNYQLNDDFSVDAEFTHMAGKPDNSATTIATQYRGLEANSFTTAIRYHF